ncbi:MAG: hypothetical protein PHX38_04860 [Sulfuricella sp.]|nr:hypothetical protein [Sulfuricella sp.]
MKRIVGAICAVLLPLAADAANLLEKFQPETPYYFDSFVSGQKPWESGQSLNIEEVFKNYQYYEIVFDSSGRGITVKHYIQNRLERRDRFSVGADGALEAK